MPWPLLERLARAAGLEPIASSNFHEWCNLMKGKEEHAALLRKMSVLDCEGTLSAMEWEAAGLYRVFAFRKSLAGASKPLLQLSGRDSGPRAVSLASSSYRSCISDGDIAIL